MTAASIGAMRARITVQRENPQAAGGGAYAVGWTNVATLWAQIEPINGREALQGARLESRVAYRLVLRYRPDIVAGMRVVWQGKNFAIQTVLDQGVTHRFTQLLVSEGGAT
jgi:SPP1 family predicted phage head-tail adaptor